MKLLDLFAGIGGFSLAAHWMGWETAGFVEWDKYNQKVLAKNFPNTPIHGDITTYHGTLHEADIITGGFPCQPFSTAGKREGANDSRYLWPEMLRVIREVQPLAVIGENVAGIYSMADGSVFEQVCTDLEDEGYAVQPFCVPACATGAPHRRDRWWFCAIKNADSAGNGRLQTKGGKREQRNAEPAIQVRTTPNAEETECKQSGRARARREGFANDHSFAPNSESKQKHATAAGRLQPQFGNGDMQLDTHTCKKRLARGELNRAPDQRDAWKQALGSTAELHENGWAQVAARLCRVDDGLPTWVDRHRTNRLKSLGNSIQPQVAYEILKALDLSYFSPINQ